MGTRADDDCLADTHASFLEETMFKFLLGVAFGAAGYWAWQSFGRDLLGLGNDQDTYGSYNSTSNFSGGTTTYGGSSSTPSSTPSSTGASTSTSTPTPSSTSSESPSGTGSSS